MTGVEATVTGGRLRGMAGDGQVVFRGVPFAAAPFGERRFKPPAAPEPWDGVRDAIAVGPGCPQPSLDPLESRSRFFNPAVTGRDCLTLNVWTPDPGAGGLPVTVWIHGGGFMTGGGSAPFHDGATWARDGVVYVSINYRLNAEGFLYLGDGTANLGLLDQVAALRWVQENIAAFGGDPGNVTVFGQSAGGVSVMHLLTMPAAAGLFRRAIAQSGSSAGAQSVDEASDVAARLATLVDAAPSAEALAAIPADRLLAGVTALAFEYVSPAIWGSRSFMISAFRPVVDGDVIPAAVVPSVADGAGAGVDLMAGTTRDETTFAMQPFGLLDHVPDEWVKLALETFGLTEGDLDVYRRASRPKAGRPELLQAAWTDWAFRIPTLRLLDAHALRARATYAYEFAWASPSQPELGATHALDTPFVFDALQSFRAAMPLTEDPVGDHAPQELADTMHRAWLRFAATGDPGWDRYDATRRTTMRFDTASAAVDDLAGPERALWDGIR